MDFSKEQIDTLKTVVEQVVKDEGRQTRDLLMQEIRASEKRTTDLLRKEIHNSEERVLDAVGDMLNGSVLPQIDDHEQRLTKLETKAA